MGGPPGLIYWQEARKCRSNKAILLIRQPRYKHFETPEEAAHQFLIEFYLWWISLQPTWRRGEQLRKDSPKTEKWTTFNIRGGYGMATLIGGLVIWLQETVAPSQEDQEKFKKLVSDFRYVLGEVSNVRPESQTAQPKKRAQPDQLPNPNGRKLRRR